jgi:hypothetical protein
MAMSSLRDKIVLAVAVTSCVRTQPPVVPRVRFANAAPVMIVDDRRPIAHRPRVSPSMINLDFFDRSFAGPIDWVLSLPVSRRARGINAIDEVPDSTWFTNRIGVRDMTPDEIARGPLSDEGPEPYKPWTIRSTKSGGTELGFIMTDARGIKYGISFDAADLPELETGTAVVVNRLLYACGYNVPEDRVAYVRPDELVVAPDAASLDTQGRKLRHLDRREFDRLLAGAWHTSDGRIRVLASRWLGGDSLGGSPPTGTRQGDPNDRIPHQDRRDLRGQYPIFAWLNHLDLVQSNFLDMWIATPNDHTKGYVVHYLIDFGKSLGAIAVMEHNLRAGHEYLFDFSEPIITLGLMHRPWGQHWAPKITGVSPTFVIAGFDPGDWKPDIPYAPFDAADKFDKFWGAKILAHFTPEQIRAAVEAGRFTDPRATEYLTATLVARQKATVAWWYARVNPLDQFAVSPEGFCFEDLAIAQQLASPAHTRYELATYDLGARPLGTTQIDAVPGQRACTRAMKMAGGADGYTIVKVTTSRPQFAGATTVHLARAPDTGQWRVIGVWRS